MTSTQANQNNSLRLSQLEPREDCPSLRVQLLDTGLERVWGHVLFSTMAVSLSNRIESLREE